MKSLYHSFYIAWSTLTAVPLPHPAGQTPGPEQFRAAARLFPLVGAIIGLVLAAVALILQALSVPVIFSAIGIVLLYYLFTGFLHLDGFCDVCDAFFAHADATRRLEILKDSRLGTYALALGVLMLITKVALIHQLLGSPAQTALLILSPVWARLAMVLLSAVGRYPRQQGTGRPFIGTLQFQDVIIAAGLAAGVMAAVAGLCRLGPLLIGLQALMTAAVLLAMYGWSRTKIGGVTGDVLGAAGELLDIVVLGGSLALL